MKKAKRKTTKSSTQSVEGTVNVCCHYVTYRYWDFTTELTDGLRQDLENSAEERAKECIIDGCHSGDLNHLHTDTEEEIRGWWEIAD